MRSFGKTLLKLFLFLCIFSAIFAGVFLFAFNKSAENSYSKSDLFLSETVDSINKLNASINAEGSITSISGSLKIDLEDARDSLLKIKNELNSKNIPSKYEELSDNISMGLEYNINLYKEILRIPNIKSSNAMQGVLEDLNDNANKCISYYGKTADSDFKVNFSENQSILIGKIQKLILEKKIVLDKKMLQNSLKEKYIAELNTVYSQFLQFYQNRNKDAALTSAQKNNQYDELIESLENEIKSINGLLKNVTPIIPAPDSTDITEDLSDLLYDYVMYLQFFKHSVSFEMNSAEMITDDVKAQLDKFYETSKENLQKCETSYRTFETKFQKLKKSLN